MKGLEKQMEEHSIRGQRLVGVNMADTNIYTWCIRDRKHV